MKIDMNYKNVNVSPTIIETLNKIETNRNLVKTTLIKIIENHKMPMETTKRVIDVCSGKLERTCGYSNDSISIQAFKTISDACRYGIITNHRETSKQLSIYMNKYM